jgi:hypothetical protein
MAAIGVGLLAGLAALAGLWAGARGIRLMARGLIVWICLTCAALGALLEQAWLLVFAGLWLLEEIYETGVLASILRDGAHPRAAPGSVRVR